MNFKILRCTGVLADLDPPRFGPQSKWVSRYGPPGPNPLANMEPRGPYLLADLNPPLWIWTLTKLSENRYQKWKYYTFQSIMCWRYLISVTSSLHMFKQSSTLRPYSPFATKTSSAVANLRPFFYLMNKEIKIWKLCILLLWRFEKCKGKVLLNLIQTQRINNATRLAWRHHYSGSVIEVGTSCIRTDLYNTKTQKLNPPPHPLTTASDMDRGSPNPLADIWTMGFKSTWGPNLLWHRMWSIRCWCTEASDQGKNCKRGVGLWPVQYKFSKTSAYLQRGVYAECTQASNRTYIRAKTKSRILGSPRYDG